MGKYFKAADILLPGKCDFERWAVIACDQFTSDKAYWKRVRTKADGVPSTLHMILPEAELSQATPESIDRINACMRRYLAEGVFTQYQDSYVYVERTLQNGQVRQGVVGMLDLEHYEYDPSLHPMISATENTVLERIPPRVAVRKDAPVELTHVLLLCEDCTHELIEAVAAQKEQLPKLYEFDLMEGGGHIAGWLLSGDAAQRFGAAVSAYEQEHVYLVGDGNHSLVTAKTCYEELKKADSGAADHPARYALVELENIHTPAMAFEPIHRIITHTDPRKMLEDLAPLCGPEGTAVEWVIGRERGRIFLKTPQGALTVGVLQEYLDRWLQENPGQIDYIHGDEELAQLASQDGAIGFLLPPMPKDALFPFVQTGKTLPRKTFSMGHGCEKRYYLEGRKIK